MYEYLILNDYDKSDSIVTYIKSSSIFIFDRLIFKGLNIYQEYIVLVYWLLYSDWSTSYLIRALTPYHSHLLLLLSHVVIVVKPCCVEGLMEYRCISNKHSRY